MAMEKQDVTGQGAPVKFSRYRSVRKAASKMPQEVVPVPASLPLPPPPPLPVSSTSDPSTRATAGGMNRSMSRYRRQRAPTAASSDATQPPVPDRAVAYRAHAQGSRPGSVDAPRGAEYTEDPNRRNATKANTTMRERIEPTEESKDEALREKHRQDAMDRLTGGEKPRKPIIRDREARYTEERQYRSQGDNVTSRRRSSQEPKRVSLKESAKLTYPKDQTGYEGSEQVIDSGLGNRPAGFDAPVSAVNAGERHVVVQYRKTSMDLTVTPSTSAQDLLFTASECLAGEIDPQKFILMESFAELGLERPLRRYEYVREVMNSWAHDRQNSLLIVPAASLEALSLLDAQCVPSEQPVEVTLHMYYSQRPRKWDKRFVTLRSDGQVTVSKKEQGQEQANACHMSDFDIYSPTPGYLSNHVKPPKKICQAVKSQQKSNMFLSTENFVHHFATNDKAIADAWYRAVHTWRSWYLVNMLGAGNEEKAAVAEEIPPASKPFKPLLDMDSPESSSGEGKRSSKSKELFSRKKSTREHAPPPSSFPKLLADEPDLAPPPPPPLDDSPFNSSGLLGRSYTLRQRAMKEREEREKKAREEPFVAQGLISNMGRRPANASTSRPNSRSNTMTSTQAPDPTGLKRSQSTHKNKPLVDLTPVYQEPPQHTRKGKGVAVEPGTLLIDAATGREAPGGIAVPSATTWRRPAPELPAPNTEIRTRNRSNTTRSNSNHSHHFHTSTAPASPISPVDAHPRVEPFIPNSLLSRSAQLATMQNGVPVGHGVATGDRMATKPMLDMSPENPFTHGLALNRE
ncbi:hypothetical protein EYZ11_007804 [Aspergillus tanneri]|uniref:PH domain-containing protein n=1 Tax=Aspergillus tanneri TaxID=1220188 RepID=A0A4S3JEA8_9EURO|nr:hypothetical protein EYZ11_007804 [Aspergillus tanneri]